MGWMRKAMLTSVLQPGEAVALGKHEDTSWGHVLPHKHGASLRFCGGLGEVSWQVELGSPGLEDDLGTARRRTGARGGVLDPPRAFGDMACLAAWP